MKRASAACIALALAATSAEAQSWYSQTSGDVTLAGISFDATLLELNCVRSSEPGANGFSLSLLAGAAGDSVIFVVDTREPLEFQMVGTDFRAERQDEFDLFARLIEDLRAGSRVRIETADGDVFLPLRGSSRALETCPTDIVVAAAPDPTPEPEPIPVQPETVAAPPDPVSEIENLLAVLGYTVGASDGAIDEALHRAIAVWQRDTGRDPSGGISVEDLAALRAQAIGDDVWVIAPPETAPLPKHDVAPASDYGLVALNDCPHRKGFGRLSYNRGVSSTRPNPTLLTEVCFDEAGGTFVSAETLDDLTPVPGPEELRKFEILTGDPANRTAVSVGRDAQAECGRGDGEGFTLATAPGNFEIAQHPDTAWVVGEGYFLETVAAPSGEVTFDTTWVSIVPTSVNGEAFWAHFKSGFSGLSLWGDLPVSLGAGDMALESLGTDDATKQSGSLSVSIGADGVVEAKGTAMATYVGAALPEEWTEVSLEIGPLTGHSLDGGTRIMAFGPALGTMTLGDGKTVELTGDATLQACAK